MPLTRQNFTPEQYGAFSPEVQAALTANQSGQNNQIVGGAITERDPNFSYAPPAPPGAPVYRYTASPNPLEQAIQNPLQAGGYYDLPPNAGVVPGGQYYQNPDGSFTSQNPEDRIKEQSRRDMQSYIDAINAQYSNLISQEQQRGTERLGETRAIGARSGLLGSDFGAAQKENTRQYNAQSVKAIEDQRNLSLQSVYTNIDQRAREEIAAKKQEALGNAERYIAYLQQSQEQARNDFLTLAKGGVDLNTLDPARKKKLMEQSGYAPDLAELIYNSQKPKPQQIDYQYKIENGKLFAFGVDPNTGQIVTKTVDTGIPDLPPNYSPTFAPDGTLILTPDKFDPNLSPEEQIKVVGNFAKPEKAPVSSGGGGGGSASELAIAVMENPALYNTLTPTQKGKILPILQQSGIDLSTLTNKPLSDTAIARITDSEIALESLMDLRTTIKSNEQYIGPLSGLQKLNPYSKARRVQAEIDAVRQRVGKALEGGVLRKEDEEKYKKILATITDTPSTAISKIDSLIKSVQRDIDTYSNNQAQAGRQVPTSQPIENLENLRAKYNY